MNRKLKGIVMCLLLLVAVVFAGCGDPYANVYVEYEGSSSAEIVLGETPNNSITVISSIKNFKNGMSELMFFSPDRSVIKIDNTESLGFGKTKITIVGLKPGTVLLKAQTLEGSKSAYLTISVLQPMTDFALKSNAEPYLIRGESNTINVLDFVNFSPITTTEKNVMLAIKDYDVLNEQGIEFDGTTLSVPEDFEGSSVTATISAYRMVNGLKEVREDIESKELEFAIISPIESEDISLFAFGNDGVGSSIENINLLSNSIDFSQKTFYIDIISTDFKLETVEEYVDITVSSTSNIVVVSNVIVDKLEGMRRIYFTLQTARKSGTGSIIMNLNFVNNNFAISKEYPISIKIVAERIEINGETSFGENEFISTYTQFSSISGTALNIMVYPTDCASTFSYVRLDYSQIPDILSLTTIMGNQILRPTNMTEQENEIGRRIDSGVLLFSDYLEITSGTIIFVKGIVESDIVQFLNFYLPLNITFEANGVEAERLVPINFTLPIKIVKGASQIIMETDVVCVLGENGETTGFEKEITFTTNPVDAYADDFTVFSTSELATFEKLQSNTFKLIPRGAGTGEVTIFLGNGTQETFDFEIVSNLKIESLVLDIQNVDSIGYKNTSSNPIEFAIKFGMEALLQTSFEPQNAKIYITFSSSDQAIIAANANSGLIVGRGIGGQTTKIIITARFFYRLATVVDGIVTVTDQEATKSIVGQCYVPLKSFTMSKSKIQIFDYNSVGYYNKELSQSLLLPVFSPINATYRNFTATDQSVSSYDASKFLISFGNPNYHISYNSSTDFMGVSLFNVFNNEKSGGTPTIYTEYARYDYATNVLEANIKSGYLPSASSITFTVKEFDNEFSFSVEFAPLLQTKVETITLSNCSEDGEIYLDANRKYFQIIANAEPLEAYNRKLKYAYFPPLGGGTTAEVSVDNNGLVSLLDSDIAGRGFVRVSAEDSYATSTEPTRYVDIPVRVADGSRNNPYTLRTANDIKNIKGDGLSKFYVLESNINLGDVSWTPLGILTGGITGNGLYTISGIRIDDVSVAAAKTLQLTDASIRDDGLLYKISNTARIRVGLFTKIEGQINNEGKYDSGFITGVNFIGSISISNSESSLLLDVGLIAAQNQGEISSCSVSLSSASVRLSTAVNESQIEYRSRVGGVAGLNVGLIKNSNLSSTGDTVISSKIGVQMLNGASFSISGINVIFGMVAGQQGEVAKGAVLARNGKLEWSKENTAFENQYLTAIVQAAVANSLTYAFGGVIGVNLALSEVHGATVIGTLTGYSNVGGLVGVNNGLISESVSCVKVGSINLGKNTGGLVGHSSGTISLSSVQVLDSDMAQSNIVSGYENVGGIVGLMTGGLIEQVFFVSYQTNQAYCNVTLNGTIPNNVGGVVGTMNAGIIRKVFSHATVAGSVNVVGDSVGSLVGKIKNTSTVTIEDFYTKSNFATDQTTLVQPVGAQEDAWGLSEVKYGYSYYALSAGVEPTKQQSISIYSDSVYFGVADAITNFVVLNTNDCWSFATGEDRPFLEFNGVAINIDPPTGIRVSANKNVLSPTNGGAQLVVYVNFYEAVNSNYQTYLTAKNTFTFSEYFTAGYEGNNPIGANFKLTNYNTEILTINSDGSATIKKTGLAKISVISKFNSEDKIDMYIYVVNAAQKLDVFVGADFTSRLGNTVTLLLKKDVSRKLYAQLSNPNINYFNGDTNVSIEIKKNSVPNLFATETTLNATEDSIAFNFANGFFTVTGINEISSGTFVLQSVIKIQIDGKNYSANLISATKSFSHVVSIGAKNIMTSTSAITTVPYFKNIIDVVIETDDVNEKVEIVVSRIESSGAVTAISLASFQTLFKSFASSYEIVNGKVYLKTIAMTDTLGAFNGTVQGQFHFELNEAQKYIQTQTKFTVQFVASNNIVALTTVTINPQPVLDINISQFNKLSDSSPSSERSNIITPGVTAAFTLMINPNYSSFDYIDIVSDNPANIVISLSVIGTTSSYNSILISGGIRLERSFVKYLIDTYGRIKIGMLCASSVVDQSNVSVKIQAVSNGVISIEKNVSYIARNSVKVTELSVLGLVEGSDTILVQGKEYEIKFETTGNPDTIEFVSNPAYTISQRDGVYYLVVLSNDEVYAETDITVNIAKVVDQISYANTATIEVNIAKIAVLSAPIADLDYESYTINTPKGNALDLYALFDYGNSIMYDQTNWNLTSDIDDLNAQANTNAIWEYSPIGDEDWQPIGYSDIYEDSFKAIGNKITIFQDIVPFKFRLRIRVAYDFTGTVKLPTIVPMGTTLPESMKYVDKTTEFTFEIFLNTSTFNAIPVRTQEDLMNMRDGYHYILLNDIQLVNDTFSPISASVASFNGNNKKIYLPSSITVPAETNIEYALFKEVAAGSVIQNVTVAIASNTTLLVESSGTYESLYFAGIAVKNYGIITNCEVTSLHNPNNDLLQTNEPFRIYVEASSSGTDIVSAGLVCINGSNGTITNSRVTLSILAPMNVAGFVHENSGKISSSYVRGVSMGNFDATGALLSGFVNKNNYSGEIFSSFVEGGFVAKYMNGQYSLTTMHSTLQKIESIDGNAASFVSENAGKITDSFANIRTIAKNYASGFVYENKQSSTITNCFSLSEMQANNNAATAFVGRNEVNTILNSGVISNCAYYMDEGNITDPTINNMLFSNANISGLDSLTKARFVNRNDTFFSTFSISTDSEKTKGVWFIPSGSFERDFKLSDESNMIFYSQRPQLVSPNIISRSEYAYLSYKENTETGAYEYSYALISSYAVGTTFNPYIIYDKANFADVIVADSQNRVTKSYRLVADIDFNDENISTSAIVFNGDLEGNGMKMTGIVLESDKTLATAGFFASIGDKTSGRGSIKNLTLGITKIYMPNTTAVGGLAGTMYGGNIANISVLSSVSSSSVIGKNIVGGIFGMTQIIKATRIFNLTSTVPAVALQQKAVSSFNINNSFKITELLSSYSYAGCISGVIFNSTLNSITLSDIKVYGTPYVIADNAGMFVGYMGKDITMSKVLLQGTQAMFVRATRTAGGVVGELVGGTLSEVTMIGLTDALAFFDTTSAWPFYAGGVVGVMRGGMIKNSTNSISITMKTNASQTKKTVVGGIAGLVNPQIDSIKTATGTIQYVLVQKAVIENCTNSASLKAEVVTGGIVGTTKELLADGTVIKGKTYLVSTKTRFSSSYCVEITNCTNTAKLESAPNNQNQSIVAGIVGLAESETRISYCKNSGEIVSSAIYIAFAGGIVGDVELSNILGSSNNMSNDNVVGVDSINITNALITRVSKSYNTGKVTSKNLSKGESLSAGGIVGRIESSVQDKIAIVAIEFAYNSGVITVEGKVSARETYGGVGGIVGDTSGDYTVAGRSYFCQTYNVGNIVNANTISHADGVSKVYKGGISGRGGEMFRSTTIAVNETAESFYLEGFDGVGNIVSDWTIPLTEAAMRNAASYVYGTQNPWNFVSRWNFAGTYLYPSLI